MLRSNLIQMMLEMIDVAHDQLAKRHRSFIADAAYGPELFLRDPPDYVDKMHVVVQPESQQRYPTCRGVGLRVHPHIAIVVRPRQLRLRERPDEALVVVRRGIDEVSQDLLGAPASVPQRRRCTLRIDCD